MKLLYKFFLPVVVITVIISVVVGVTISRQIKQTALERAQMVTAEYIAQKAYEQLTAESFLDPNYEAHYDIFRDFMRSIVTAEIIKIKAFNDKATIIYSTAKESIGQKSDSANYKSALAGKVAVEIKPPLKDEKENIDLAGYRQVMEIYVPIFIDKKIVGVVETYYKMDFINESINETVRNVLALIILYAVVVLASIYGILKMVILSPVGKLKVAADKIAVGDLNVQLPEITSKDEIRDLNEAMKGVLAAVELLTDEVKKHEEQRGSE